MNNSRERFEKFIRETRACREHSFARDGDGYRSGSMDLAWDAWQEAELQSQSEPAKELAEQGNGAMKTDKQTFQKFQKEWNTAGGWTSTIEGKAYVTMPLEKYLVLRESLLWPSIENSTSPERRPSFVSCECPAGVGNACTLSGSECIERSEANRRRDASKELKETGAISEAEYVDRLIEEPSENVRAKQETAPLPDRLQACSMGACASFMELNGMWEMAKPVRDYLESIQGKV